MNLVAIDVARVTAILELKGFDPKGRSTDEEALAALSERYAFSVVPKTADEMDYSKGVRLQSGRLKDIAIQTVMIYTNGLVIDTRSTTDDCLSVLADVLDVAKILYGSELVPIRVGVLSQIIFKSSLRLQLLNPILQPIADRLAEVSSKAFNQPIVFEPTGITLAPDSSQLKIGPATFSIERREETPFSENTYFSRAPIDTASHIKIIEEVESSLRGNP